MPETGLSSSTAPSPSVSEKITAGATWLTTNGAVAAAPLLNNLDPSMNPDLIGGPAVVVLAHLINGLIQGLKQHDFYDQNKYAIWTVLALAFAICLALWHDNLRQGILNGSAVFWEAWTNYGPLNRLGIAPAGPGGSPSVSSATLVTPDGGIIGPNVGTEEHSR